MVTIAPIEDRMHNRRNVCGSKRGFNGLFANAG
jgi:hypothetical protein